MFVKGPHWGRNVTSLSIYFSYSIVYCRIFSNYCLALFFSEIFMPHKWQNTIWIVKQGQLFKKWCLRFNKRNCKFVQTQEKLSNGLKSLKVLEALVTFPEVTDLLLRSTRFYKIFQPCEQLIASDVVHLQLNFSIEYLFATIT